MMNRDRSTNRTDLDFIVSSILGQYRLGSLSQAAKLIHLADQAITTRQTRELSRITNALLQLPLTKQFEFIHQYYAAIAIHDFGRGDSQKALTMQLEVAERAPLLYRARAESCPAKIKARICTIKQEV